MTWSWTSWHEDERPGGAGLPDEVPGVGIKTAACVLMFSLGRPVMPVDTHVFRVCGRLDFLPEDATGKAPTRHPQRHRAEDDRYSFHINLVLHGRKVCKALRPRCGECLIEEGLCPSGSSENKGFILENRSVIPDFFRLFQPAVSAVSPAQGRVAIRLPMLKNVSSPARRISPLNKELPG